MVALIEWLLRWFRVFFKLKGGIRRGRGGKEKEWTDCTQSDIRAFGIAGDWKATALKAEVWVETVKKMRSLRNRRAVKSDKTLPKSITLKRIPHQLPILEICVSFRFVIKFTPGEIRYIRYSSSIRWPVHIITFTQVRATRVY